jgi:hypothetical protein
MASASRVEQFLSPALCQGVILDHDCRLGKNGTCVAL